MDEEIGAMINMGLHPISAKEFALAGIRAKDIETLMSHCYETGESPEPYIRAMIDAIHRLPVDITSWGALTESETK